MSEHTASTRIDSYWLEAGIELGSPKPPAKSGEILVIGSGVAGVSSCYWLQKEGFENITLIDYKPEEAASFRNCGHVLYGTVESMKGLCSLYGKERAKKSGNSLSTSAMSSEPPFLEKNWAVSNTFKTVI